MVAEFNVLFTKRFMPSEDTHVLTGVGWNALFHNLRNGKHFPCFHMVIETRVEVWEIEKLKWEHEPTGRNVSTLF